MKSRVAPIIVLTSSALSTFLTMHSPVSYAASVEQAPSTAVSSTSGPMVTSQSAVGAADSKSIAASDDAFSNLAAVHQDDSEHHQNGQSDAETMTMTKTRMLTTMITIRIRAGHLSQGGTTHGKD